MSNTFILPSVVAKEALMALENELVMANLIHKGFSPEFQQKAGATITVRRPATFEATAFSTTVAAQDIVESSVQVVLEHHLDITTEITTAQLTLELKDLSEQVIQPMMREFAQKVDYYILQDIYDTVAGHTAVSGTPAVSDLANLMAQLDLQKCPIQGRRAVLHPITQAKYASVDAILNADKRGKSLTIDEYRIGRVLGCDYYMDQNIPTFDSGISDTAGAFQGAAAAGATTATIDALTDSEIIAAGDVFKVVGSDKGYLIVTGGTVASNTQIVTFTPALDSAILDNAVVTFQGDCKRNLAFHQNAFTIAMAPLAPYIGGVMNATASYKGISCRVAYDAALSNKVNQMSVDLLFGVKTLDKDLAAILCD